MKNFILPLAREKTGYLSMATSEDSAISTGARKKEDIHSTIQILQHGSGQNLLADPKV